MQLTDVSFRYRRRDSSVIREVKAQLAPGDVIELAGVNGAGKSTLLRLLAGLLRPTGGTITGRPASVGLAPDRFPAEQPFTVAGYLDHMARVCGGRWRPWAPRLNMEHLLGVRLRELSKGSAHKVGLAQALMAGPGLLLLDEPFAGLDADTREALPSIVADLSERGAIVVVSDHQGGLHDLPSLRRWTLVSGRLTEPAASGGTPEAPIAVPAAGSVGDTREPTPVPALSLAGGISPNPAAEPSPGIAAGSAGETRAGSAGEIDRTPARDTQAGPAGKTDRTPARDTQVSSAGKTDQAPVGETREGSAGETGVTVEVIVPVEVVAGFVERMRGEGYPARPVSLEESR